MVRNSSIIDELNCCNGFFMVAPIPHAKFHTFPSHTLLLQSMAYNFIWGSQCNEGGMRVNDFETQQSTWLCKEQWGCGRMKAYGLHGWISIYQWATAKKIERKRNDEVAWRQTIEKRDTKLTCVLIVNKMARCNGRVMVQHHLYRSIQSVMQEMHSQGGCQIQERKI